jgi:hypothetical protein
LTRNLDYFIRLIREELRAEGADGAGYSDFKIVNAINTALSELSEVYPVRDILTLVTEESVNEYDFTATFPDDEIVDIIHIAKGNKTLVGIDVNTYLSLNNPLDGETRHYLIWGNKLMLTGEIPDDDEYKLWVTRLPKKLVETDLTGTPEIPSYADDAVIQYAIATCYRESRDYERAAYHLDLYNKEKAEIIRRGIPQKQRNHTAVVRNRYSEAIGQNGLTRKTDTNPSGEV